MVLWATQRQPSSVSPSLWVLEVHNRELHCCAPSRLATKRTTLNVTPVIAVYLLKIANFLNSISICHSTPRWRLHNRYFSAIFGIRKTRMIWMLGENAWICYAVLTQSTRRHARLPYGHVIGHCWWRPAHASTPAAWDKMTVTTDADLSALVRTENEAHGSVSAYAVVLSYGQWALWMWLLRDWSVEKKKLRSEWFSLRFVHIGCVALPCCAVQRNAMEHIRCERTFELLHYGKLDHGCILNIIVAHFAPDLAYVTSWPLCL